VRLTDAECVAKTVAHWIKVRRQQLADMPGLANALNQRLTYGVNRRLEAQILNGDGTGENLLGILHTAGIGAPASVTGDSVNSDLALNGLQNVMAAAAIPDAVVLNPADWVKMVEVKASGSGERLDSDGAFSAPLTTLWGLQVVLNLASRRAPRSSGIGVSRSPCS
jgi:HK97 family phage major capsid protein